MQHFEAERCASSLSRRVREASGKPRFATSLAVAAEAQGERVLLLDLDPQGSSMLWSQTRGQSRPPTVIDVAPEKLNVAFDFMWEKDPFSGHIVIRSTDKETIGSQYRL